MALGTSVAYVYSVIVVFAPDILPVEVGERDVYFEVSAVIIAFVLLGKYMEDIIKKKSSAIPIAALGLLNPIIACGGHGPLEPVGDRELGDAQAPANGACVMNRRRGPSQLRAEPSSIHVTHRVDGARRGIQ